MKFWSSSKISIGPQRSWCNPFVDDFSGSIVDFGDGSAKILNGENAEEKNRHLT